MAGRRMFSGDREQIGPSARCRSAQATEPAFIILSTTSITGGNTMRMTSNTIFITGGTSGIGQGLAEAFHKLGNQVVVAGRREDRLKSICAANSGMKHYVLDVANPESVRKVALRAIEQFPALNCVFNNAGIQTMHDFSAGKALDE